MKSLLQDVRYGLRMLRRTPGFTVVAILTLALGIGMNTAIFSVVNAVLLRPLPYRDPAQLTLVFSDELAKGMRFQGTSPPDFRALRDRNRSFDGLSAFYAGAVNLTGAQQAEQLAAENVSSDFFSTLGVKPILGRTFLRNDEQWGSHHVVVLSEPFWRTHFGSDQNLSQLTLQLNGEPYSVVGVVPAGFQFFDNQQVWMPMAWAPGDVMNTHNNYFLTMIGRFKSGVKKQQAFSDLNSIMGGIAEQFPENKGIGVNLQPLRDAVVGDVRTALLALLGAVGFVLLIACVNIANLLLARSAGRQKEIAIRAALGAGRGRLTRQFITESLLLSVAGGTLGLMVAFWGLLLLPLVAKSVPRSHEIQMDSWVVVFTFALSALTGLLFGLAPALQSSSVSLNEVLKESGRTSGAGSRSQKLRGVLVISEVGISLVLLVGAALMIQSFRRLMHVDAGFDPAHVLTFEIDLPQSVQSGVSPYENGAPPLQLSFFEQLLARIGSLPGVKSVGVTSRLPLQGENWDKYISFADRPAPPSLDQVPLVQYRSVGGDYFRSLGIRLLEGRVFSQSDGRNQPLVVVVNKAAADHFWPHENPIGKVVSMAPPESLIPPEMMPKDLPKGYHIPRETVVGIVDNVHYGALSGDAAPLVYASMAQGDTMLTNFVTVRTQGDPTAIVPSIRSVLSETDKNQPMANITSMEQIWSDSVNQPHLESMLFGLFGGLGLGLAALGLYGVISYSTTLRTREIGIRMALGATRSNVLEMILRQGMRLAAIGASIGLVLSFALTRLLATLLFGIKATDPLTFAAVAVVLIGAAMAASYLPARRAAKVDPMVALRYE